MTDVILYLDCYHIGKESFVSIDKCHAVKNYYMAQIIQRNSFSTS